ncbi:pyridoxal-dependent decarboxylase [Sorangium cellulosum]|uniref:Pyridoxal-dependent decarboxylase n=1 Tax=Sorangium cellulosum TaxID=56 RepID=A0A2L0F5F1_SORCE|nr:aminotransferase class I/II-fold pyridoxal phosphate-dependent enzyme [Sorangium cellulosum]AUX46669.1 pyridoxal-dependent decarboxylase [Sorangium cellulosum]
MTDALTAVFSPDFLERESARVGALLADYVRRAQRREGPVLVQRSIEEILAALDFDRAVAHGGADLAALVATVLDNSNRLHHPRYFGHQVAVPMLPSSLADLVHGVLNNGMAVYEMGPAGTAIERGLVRWMRGKIGWGDEGDGILTHGGSLGNLSALLACRERVAPGSFKAGVPSNLVLLASEAAHYSVARAASIMGLGGDAVVKIAVDDALRIVPGALSRACDEAARAGKRVLAVVANAGATPNGAFDPLREIGAFCRREGLWLHVDGAHGGAALFTGRYRELLDGVELADSIVCDMHKMLGTSTLACAVLVKDRAALAGTYEQYAPYLHGDEERQGVDLSKLTFECTKAQLSLKLFFNLALVGEAGLAAHVERLFDSARRFHDLLARRPSFECFGAPQANILCFRIGRDSQAQDHIRQQLVQEGSFYVTRTTLRGESWLRLVIMNPRTSDADIEALAARIEALAHAPAP